MVDGSLIFEGHTSEWTKTLENVQSTITIFSLVMITVISRLLRKISR